jgi:TP901-1 family phage major tail protein
MAKNQGREMLVKIRTSTGPDVFSTLCGLNSKTITINNNEIDVTTADCTTPGGALWTEVLGGAKRVNVSGNGLFEDSAAEATLNTLAMAADPRSVFQVIVPDFGTFAGTFLLSSTEYGGEVEGGVTYSLALASSGAVTFTAEA